ncbi:hypothetical protein DSM25558_4326 [Agrobacterium sp. DSM 25558]|uniref:hypothetical protein n=1 Tax=Agrobacterium sp. DSM 25558 TaxID=1907665 RepID=UPI000972442B|nr:hypothetical protein [Agrobacterium sp. DSM 25558]SCX27901.1 hypothetical protein DSM25558_4326 [Agrobacterium sp. DSM 25558]
MRKILLATAATLLFSCNAFAADPTEPVKKVMDITVKNWSGEADDWKYIFDEDLLTTLFSKQFVTQYREASKKPASDVENSDKGDPFGYDVVTNSQDGCPLQDVTIVPTPPKDGVTDVTVKFKLWACMDEAEMKATVDQVNFDVVEEDGKPVINDIHRVGDEGRDSLLQEMANIIKGE